MFTWSHTCRNKNGVVRSAANICRQPHLPPRDGVPENVGTPSIGMRYDVHFVRPCQNAVLSTSRPLVGRQLPLSSHEVNRSTATTNRKRSSHSSQVASEVPPGRHHVGTTGAEKIVCPQDVRGKRRRMEWETSSSTPPESVQTESLN